MSVIILSIILILFSIDTIYMEILTVKEYKWSMATFPTKSINSLAATVCAVNSNKLRCIKFDFKDNSSVFYDLILSDCTKDLSKVFIPEGDFVYRNVPIISATRSSIWDHRHIETNAYDDDITSVFATGRNDKEPWITFNLGESKKVIEVKLIFRVSEMNNRMKNIDIRVGDHGEENARRNPLFAFIKDQTTVCDEVEIGMASFSWLRNELTIRQDVPLSGKFISFHKHDSTAPSVHYLMEFNDLKILSIEYTENRKP